MSERVFAEAKLKSDELLPAVDQAMALAGDALEEGERVAIDSAKADVRKALESGDSARLKEANATLDAATQTLAALVMEQAMEGMLE